MGGNRMSKKFLVIGFILCMATMMTGCIVAYTPHEYNQTMQAGDSLTFKIVLFQSQHDITWYVDAEEQPAAYGKTTFTYQPGQADIGTHCILVVETSTQSGSQPVMWKVTVTP